MHQREADDQADGPDGYENEKRDGPEDTEGGLADFVGGDEASDGSPEVPEIFVEETGKAKTAGDAPGEDDDLKGVPDDDKDDGDADGESGGGCVHGQNCTCLQPRLYFLNEKDEVLSGKGGPRNDKYMYLGNLADEFGGDGDFGFEKFGDRAAGFRGFDGGVEFGLIGAGNAGHEVEMRLGDGETVADFFERYGGGGFEFFGGEAGAAELRRKSHGEAAGVGGGEELFGIGADATFEAGVEGVGGLFKDAAVGGERAFAGLQIALPNCRSFALHENSP